MFQTTEAHGSSCAATPAAASAEALERARPTAAAAASPATAAPELLALLARTAFPGPCYEQHLLALHRTMRPASYLEIGVFEGAALALARPGTRAVGVDPMPCARSSRGYEAETHIHIATSDAFFAALPSRSSGAPTFDLAFIDGLHLFEQVLRDFINVERHCHPDSLVLLHDTLPVAAAAATRQRHTSYWCGDVWKIVPCLRRYRPDLRLLTVPTFPSGLTMVRGLDPGSRVLEQSYHRAIAEFIHAPLPAASMPPAYCGDVANDPQQVRAWLLPH